jgi:acyl-CoA synthetase (AMP-forming)/AMP-acid ligase II
VTAAGAEVGSTTRVAETIHGALEAAATARSSSLYFVAADGSFTTGQTAAEVDRVARMLVAAGLHPRDRAVVWLPNGLPWISLFYALARIGAVTVTAGPRLRMADMPYLLEHSRARALFYTPEFVGTDYEAMVGELLALRGRGGLESLELVVRVGEGAPRDGVLSWRELPAGDRLPDPPDPGAPAVVCYTGGTTGRPKGCVHDHRTLARNAAVAAGLTGLKEGERLVSPMPFAHVFGFHMGVLQCMVGGATLVDAEPFAPGTMLDLVERHRGTVLYGVPTMARELIEEQRARPRDLGSLRVALVAGAPVSPSLRRAVLDDEGLGCELSVVYGATESPTLTQLLPGDPEPQKLDSVGRATPGIELRIFAPGTTDPLPAGEVGEIGARGYNQMIGYLDDPEATAEKRRGEWILTGDLGRLDGEGYLYVAGRSSDMFLCGGFNVYPREVENQLEQMPGITEAVVVAVPDVRLGEVGLAFVTTDISGLTEAAILAWSREQLATYKRPSYARIVDSIPRTHAGKTARAELANEARRLLPDLPWEPADG